MMKTKIFIWGVLDVFLAFFFLQYFSFFTFQTFAETGEVLSGEDITSSVPFSKGEEGGSEEQNPVDSDPSVPQSGTAPLQGEPSHFGPPSEGGLKGGLIEEETTPQNDNMEQSTTENTPATWENVTGTGLNILEISPDNQVLSWSGIDSWELLTWINTRQSRQLIDTGVATGGGVPQLQITEVYFDGHDERIEITNNGTEDFSGNLTIIWAKAVPVTIASANIPAEESVLIGDSFSMLINQNKVIQNNIWLNIYDTQTMNIQLEYSWTQLDTFQVDEATIKQANSLKKTSLHRFNDTNEVMIASWRYSDNVLSGFTANPWKVWMSTDEWNSTWNNTWNSWTWTNTGTGTNTFLKSMPMISSILKSPISHRRRVFHEW